MPRPGLSEQPSNSSANPARAALVLLTYRNVGIDKRGASRLASPFAKRVFSFRARPCRARLYRRDCADQATVPASRP